MVVMEITRLSHWNCITMELKSHVTRPMLANHGILRMTSLLLPMSRKASIWNVFASMWSGTLPMPKIAPARHVIR
jgi:hypothetical protein